MNARTTAKLISSFQGVLIISAALKVTKLFFSCFICVTQR